MRSLIKCKILFDIRFINRYHITGACHTHGHQYRLMGDNVTVLHLGFGNDFTLYAYQFDHLKYRLLFRHVLTGIESTMKL